MANLKLTNIVKNYGETKVVKDISLEVKDQEFVVLVGPSGCGKSTLLRMIAGLENVTEGSVLINDEDVTHKEPGKRGVAMVFQDYALYPHMSVYENMAFGLRLKNLESKEIEKKVEEAAHILGLGPLLKRKPSQLSGGQRQRVAMGRAFVKDTSLYLFDEPLSNLDAKLRAKMRLEIKKFHTETKGSIVYVTHDQLEAMTLADKIVVLNKGKIEQMGRPLEVFDFPHTQFVASFIGSPSMNFLEGTLKKEGNTELVETKLGRFPLPKGKFSAALSSKSELAITLGLRPSDLYLAQADDRKDWQVSAEVYFVELLGKNAYINLRCQEHELVGEIMGRDLPEQGSKVTLSLNLEHAHLFERESGVNLLLKHH
jgi:ABC-type sugar transport system ATPase subunit